jgi:hypothetical protein
MVLLDIDKSVGGKRKTNHGRYTLHDDEDGTTQEEKHVEGDDNGNGTSDSRHLQTRSQCHGPKNSRQLLMSQ